MNFSNIILILVPVALFFETGNVSIVGVVSALIGIGMFFLPRKEKEVTLEEDGLGEIIKSVNPEASDQLKGTLITLKTYCENNTKTLKDNFVNFANIRKKITSVKDRNVQTVNSSNSILKESEAELSNVKVSLDDGMKSIDNLNHAIKGFEMVTGYINSINELCKQMSEHINSINSLSRESKLVTFNAHVEANRAGEHGRTFAVVAEKMQELSDNISIISSGATENIDSIMKETEGKYEELLKTLDESKGSVLEANSTVGKVLDNTNSLGQVLGKYTTLIGEFRDLGNTLNSMMDDMRNCGTSLGMGMSNSRLVEEKLYELEESVTTSDPVDDTESISEDTHDAA